ncbi:hypothetical protein [Rariglobus hedericola]|uniref:Uncharacterized protein n=1 Tax=Rariglobus hedericola TaxID=2597822 RepID=A0A556QQS5_9BACT|nr:hypothetical protein [Rariglobus hedericola]TSJ78982.1 hypothetical protein FPL22_06680 [Rariglobus hedericola]
MQIIRFIIAGIVVIVGLLAAIAVMLFGVAFYIVQRLRGRPATRPAFRTSARPRPMRTADVIDIEATEVKS